MNRSQESKGGTRFETTGFESSTPEHFAFLYNSTPSRFRLYLFSIPPRSLPPPLTNVRAYRVSSLRRFCPPPRETINFLDLNPGLRATTTTTTTMTIDRFHGAYMYVGKAERRNAACTRFMRPCLPV